MQHGSFVVPSSNGQNYRFDGYLLASSSSWRRDSTRWVEFTLHRSSRGAFVLGRTGHSLQYHKVDCEVVERNGLEVGAAMRGGVPCSVCEPNLMEPVCPERARHWAGVFTDPQTLVAALQRDNGSMKYMTNVAARLMEQAAVHDRALAEVWATLLVD